MCAKKAEKKAESSLPEQTTVLQESYDDMPYESFSYPQTHPERLYTTGKLFGLAPSDIHKARILELGCAAGGNIIPLAMLYPKTEILGIDLSQEQVAQAQAHKKALNLKNIEFRQGDIGALKDLGKYDYIICHGVFSWVPDFVRDKIFDICRNHLSADGLAVISFNALPGWSAVKSLREMMLFHTRGFATPAQQIHEAKSLLNFLYENTPPANETYRQIIDRERKILSSTNDSYIFHEHLESENHQYYLHEFVDLASKHGLGYVGDAEIASMYLGNFNPKVRETLGKIKDIVRQEQYMDFLTNRRFRHSVLTLEKNLTKINRQVNPKQIENFYVQARFYHDAAESEKGGKAKFKITGAEAVLNTSDAFTADVFKALAEKPRPVKIDDLAKELHKTKKMAPEKVKEVFYKNGFTLVLQNFISLHAGAPDFITNVSKKPKAFAWARQVAATQKQAKCVTNIKREIVSLVPFTRTLLPHLDGTKTLDGLVAIMTDHVLKGDIKMHKDSTLVTDKKEIAKIIREELDPALKKLASMALFEA